MSIPIATTTVTVLRASEPEPGEGRTLTEAAAAVRAVIGSLSGSESVRPGGGRSTSDAKLTCDVADIIPTDVIEDDTTGERWEVEWVEIKPGLGLDHMEGGLARYRGAAA